MEKLHQDEEKQNFNFQEIGNKISLNLIIIFRKFDFQ
jgi:hypothetical protein